MKRYFSSIIKVTGNCNLRCKYCYYVNPNHHGRKLIDIDLVFDFLEQASQLFDHINLVWHGGEPLLAGERFFEEVLEFQHRLSTKQGVAFQNSIQTNATLLSQQWISIFKRGKFSVGVSLDGPQFIHDRLRVTSMGKGSFAEVMRGINLLHSNQINFGVLAVVTRISLGYADEIFDFFLQNGITQFDFLPFVKESVNNNKKMIDDGLSLVKGEFAQFMKRIFDIWFEIDEPKVKIRYLSEILTGLLGGRQTLCKFNGTCKEFITLDYDGSLFPCDSFSLYPEFNFGNLKKMDLVSLLNSEKRKRFISRVSALPHKCYQCKYQNICHGGCRAYNYFQNYNFQDENYFCYDRQDLFAHIIARLTEEHPKLPLSVSKT